MKMIVAGGEWLVLRGGGADRWPRVHSYHRTLTENTDWSSPYHNWLLSLAHMRLIKTNVLVGVNNHNNISKYYCQMYFRFGKLFSLYQLRPGVSAPRIPGSGASQVMLSVTSLLTPLLPSSLSSIASLVYFDQSSCSLCHKHHHHNNPQQNWQKI